LYPEPLLYGCLSPSFPWFCFGEAWLPLFKNETSRNASLYFVIRMAQNITFLHLYQILNLTLRYITFLFHILTILCIQFISQNLTEFSPIFFWIFRLSLLCAFISCNFGFLIIELRWVLTYLRGFIVPMLANIIFWNVILVALYVSCGYLLS
jgi:hypothetical protein